MYNNRNAIRRRYRRWTRTRTQTRTTVRRRFKKRRFRKGVKKGYTPVGYRVNKSVASTPRWANAGLNGVQVKTLQGKPVSFPVHSQDAKDDNVSWRITRTSNNILMKGLKVNWQFKNNAPVDVKIHYGVLQSRMQKPGDGNEDVDIKKNFFTDRSNTVRSHEDFVDNTNAVSYNWAYELYGINPEKWNIISHKTMTLAPWIPGENNINGLTKDTVGTNATYYKVSRAIEFDKNTDLNANKPWYLFYWWQPVREDRYGTVSAGSNTVDFRWETVVYFKNKD